MKREGVAAVPQHPGATWAETSPRRVESGASVEVQHLTKRYGEVVSVDDVSWSAKPGEFLALLGSSGSGKSSTLHMIAGLVTPTSGDILIGGMPVTDFPPERRNLGMVFQDYALFPHMTLRDNVAFGLRMRGLRSAEVVARADRALARVGLAGLGDRMPAALSGGQRQRVALARSLVYEPPLLLMDEPLGALDKQLREQMLHELRHLHRDLGLTIVYVTHDQREALTMADRIAVMRSGRIEQIGTPVEVFTRPANRFVASFIGDCCFLRPTAALQGAKGSWLASFGGWTTEVRGPSVLSGPPELAVRPHNLKLLREGDPGLRAWVSDVVFEGETFEYLLLYGGEQSFSIRVGADEHARLGYRPGAEVTVSWSDDAAWLV